MGRELPDATEIGALFDWHAQVRKIAALFAPEALARYANGLPPKARAHIRGQVGLTGTDKINRAVARQILARLARTRPGKEKVLDAIPPGRSARRDSPETPPAPRR